MVGGVTHLRFRLDIQPSRTKRVISDSKTRVFNIYVDNLIRVFDNSLKLTNSRSINIPPWRVNAVPFTVVVRFLKT